MADLIPWIIGYLACSLLAALVVTIQFSIEYRRKIPKKKSYAWWMRFHFWLIIFIAVLWPISLLSKLYALRSKDSHE